MGDIEPKASPGNAVGGLVWLGWLCRPVVPQLQPLHVLPTPDPEQPGAGGAGS